MKKDWLIKDIPVEVYDAIKKKTIDYGCTIPELLRYTFLDPVKKDRPRHKAWTIKSIDENLVAEIKNNAIKQGVPVGEYLKGLVAVKKVTFNAKKEKAKLIKRFKEECAKFLKDFS